MAKTKAQKRQEKKLEKFKTELLQEVEKKNREAVNEANKKLQITMDKIDHEAKQLGLEDFELLRREIDNLEETITQFNPTAEAEEAIKNTISQLRAKTEELEDTINKTDEVIASVIQERAKEGRERLDQLIREIEADYRKRWEKEDPFHPKEWDATFKRLKQVTRTESQHRLIWTGFQFIFTVVAVLVGIYCWVRWFQ
jgi:hypothetical protein